MGLRTGLLAVLAVAAVAGAGFAHEFKAGDLTIGHPYALETPPTARAGAGYFSVTNHGATADTLLEVTVAAPLTAKVHKTEMQDGVARMLPAGPLEIPPGQTLTLAPRGDHVMFLGLAAPWAAGDEVAATLVFEHAGPVAVTFKVEARPAGGGDAGHGAHTGQ